jgi:hypothetical protein
MTSETAAIATPLLPISFHIHSVITWLRGQTGYKAPLLPGARTPSGVQLTINCNLPPDQPLPHSASLMRTQRLVVQRVVEETGRGKTSALMAIVIQVSR